MPEEETPVEAEESSERTPTEDRPGSRYTKRGLPTKGERRATMRRATPGDKPEIESLRRSQEPPAPPERPRRTAGFVHHEFIHMMEPIEAEAKAAGWTELEWEEDGELRVLLGLPPGFDR